MSVRTTYQRQIESNGWWMGEEALQISADVIQDSGVGRTSELCLVWTAETDALIAEFGLASEELTGCEEAIEAAFFASEQEESRLASVKQRTGERAA